MMKRFNLLPHRELKRRWLQRVLGRQIFVASGIGVVLALIGLLAISLHVAYLSAYNKVLTEALAEQAVPFSSAQKLLAQRTALSDRKTILERVDARRTTSVLIMNDVVRSRPEGLYLTRLEENGDAFRLEGRAGGSESIAKFFERMSEAGNINALHLEEIQLIPLSTGSLYGFAMHGKVHLLDVTNISGTGALP